MQELLVGLVPGLPPSLRSQILAAPKGCRSTRSRPCGCCSTAVLWSQEGTVTADRRGRRPRGAGDAARAVAARLDGLGAGGAEARAGRRRARQAFTPSALAALTGQRSGPARATARGSRAQRAARRAGGSALARARPVRVPPGPRCGRSRTRRCAKARASPQAPRGGRVPGRQRRARTRSPRSSPRICSRPIASIPALPTPRPCAPTRTPPCFAPANEPLRSAPPQRHSATSNRRPSSPTSPARKPMPSRAPAR